MTRVICCACKLVLACPVGFSQGCRRSVRQGCASVAVCWSLCQRIGAGDHTQIMCPLVSCCFAESVGRKTSKEENYPGHENCVVSNPSQSDVGFISSKSDVARCTLNVARCTLDVGLCLFIGFWPLYPLHVALFLLAGQWPSGTSDKGAKIICHCTLHVARWTLLYPFTVSYSTLACSRS